MVGRIGRTYPAPWARPALAVRNAYEGASMSRRTRGWNAPTLGPNDSTLPNLRTLRDRARKEYRDGAYGGGAVDIRVEQLIGTGITPKSLAPDERFREQVQQLFARWTDESDADGTLEFYGQQAQSTRCWQEAGEAFVRFRDRLPTDGLTVPFQLQVIEPELCPIEHTLVGGNGNPIRAGIEFAQSTRRRVAYWFHPQRPSDLQDLGRAELVRVPADRVVHLYLPTRAGQIRGVPVLHRALMTVRDLDVGDDATLLRWQLANMFVGWMSRTGVGDAAVDPITGKTITKESTGEATLALQPGAFWELLPGEEVNFNEPPEAGQTYEAFMRQQLRKIAAAARVPYHALTGDMAQVNDRTIRVILQDFRRALEQLQWHVIVYQLLRPVWNAWFDRAVLSGALEVPADYYADPVPWRAVEWAPDRWPYIHPVQDIQADREEVRAGFASRALKVKARGYDVETIDRQRAEDNQREARLGLVSDSDPAKTDRAGGKQQEADPDSAPDREPAEAGAST